MVIRSRLSVWVSILCPVILLLPLVARAGEQRQIAISIQVDGQPYLAGSASDDGTRTADELWEFLGSTTLRAVPDAVVPVEPSDILRATLRGQITIEVKYAGKVEVQELRLVRSVIMDPTGWTVDARDVEQIAEVARRAANKRARRSYLELLRGLRRLPGGPWGPRWAVTSYETNGDKASAAKLSKIEVLCPLPPGADLRGYGGELVFQGELVIMCEENTLIDASIKLDEKKQPKQADITFREGEWKWKTALGIYEYVDNSDKHGMKLCFAPPGNDRPTELSSAPGSGRILIVFESEKPVPILWNKTDFNPKQQLPPPDPFVGPSQALVAIVLPLTVAAFLLAFAAGIRRGRQGII